MDANETQMTKAQRIKLNQEFVTLMHSRRCLNKKRGPLGHGVVVHLNADADRARIDARLDEIRCALAAQ
jgi:hypothetical protein